MTEKSPKIHILVVDDEESIRNLLAELLTDEGYQVEIASSAEQALSILQDKHIDMIFSDINMPGMSGIDLLRKSKEDYNEIEFVLITAKATLDSAIESTKLGAVDYICKPFDLDEIVDLADKITKRIKKRRNEKAIVQTAIDVASEMTNNIDAKTVTLIRTDVTGSGQIYKIHEKGIILGATGAQDYQLTGLPEKFMVQMTPEGSALRITHKGTEGIIQLNNKIVTNSLMHSDDILQLNQYRFKFLTSNKLKILDRLIKKSGNMFSDGNAIQNKNNDEKVDPAKHYMSGSLLVIQMPDLMQMLNLLEKTGTLKLIFKNSIGEIDFLDGDVIAASLETVKGEKAIYRMLMWSEGDFEFFSKRRDVPPTISMSLDRLLLDGMRQQDEICALGKTIPPRSIQVTFNNSFFQNKNIEPQKNDVTVLKAIEINGLIGSVLDTVPLSDLEIFKTLIRLKEIEAITIVGSN